MNTQKRKLLDKVNILVKKKVKRNNTSSNGRESNVNANNNNNTNRTRNTTASNNNQNNTTDNVNILNYDPNVTPFHSNSGTDDYRFFNTNSDINSNDSGSDSDYLRIQFTDPFIFTSHDNNNNTNNNNSRRKKQGNKRNNTRNRLDFNTLIDTVYIYNNNSDIILDVHYYIEALSPFLTNHIARNSIINFIIIFEATNKKLNKTSVQKLKKRVSTGVEEQSCTICLQNYKKNDNVRMLKCNHEFHCKCVDPWLIESHASCPICRKEVDVL